MFNDLPTQTNTMANEFPAKVSSDKSIINVYLRRGSFFYEYTSDFNLNNRSGCNIRSPWCIFYLKLNVIVPLIITFSLKEFLTDIIYHVSVTAELDKRLNKDYKQ